MGDKKGEKEWGGAGEMGLIRAGGPLIAARFARRRVRVKRVCGKGIVVDYAGDVGRDGLCSLTSSVVRRRSAT